MTFHFLSSVSRLTPALSVSAARDTPRGWYTAQESGEKLKKMWPRKYICTSIKNRSATGHVRPVCDLARTESHVEDVATLTGLGVGLSLLAVFIWFTLRLFSKARNVESRYDYQS